MQKGENKEQRWLGLVLVVLVASELAYLYSGIEETGFVAKAIIAILPVLALLHLRWREGYLLTLCFALLATAIILDKPVLALTTEGLSRSAYLASFILLMALLREGATTSPAVLEVGRFLTLQPSRRRFATVFGGAHFFSVLINLGSLSLLAPIIQRGVRAGLDPQEPLDEISAVRERRQLSATLRGFSWFLVWAPTAVTQAVMPTLMSGIDPIRLMVTGLFLAMLMFAVSWIEDIGAWRGLRRRLQAEGRMPSVSAQPIPLPAFRNLGIVCAALVGLTLVFFFSNDVTIVTGVMLAAPLVVAIWLFVQQPSDTSPSRLALAGNRYGEIGFISLPGYVREAVFIGCAGFIGTLAAALIPADEVASALSLATMPGWLFLTGLTVLVWLFGQVGFSPITMAVFLGSVVAELPGIPTDITLAALAIAAGTAVCSTGAPFASGPILLSRVTGYSSQTLTWGWNGRYTLIAIAVLTIVYVVLDRF